SACRTAPSARRHALGRRAANVGDRARNDARAEDHSARRADRRPYAAHGIADPADHRQLAPRWRRHPVGRAKRAADARSERARLHHGKGERAPRLRRLRAPRQRPGHQAVSGSVSMDAAAQLFQSIPVDQILIQTINGIVTGMILALVASGLTLIFGIMEVVNFAHGELFMLGAYVGTTVLVTTGNFWVALLVA